MHVGINLVSKFNFPNKLIIAYPGAQGFNKSAIFRPSFIKCVVFLNSRRCTFYKLVLEVYLVFLVREPWVFSVME